MAVVVTTYDDLAFLPDALDSVAAQTRAADTVVVVDDGSSQDPGPVVARYPGVRLVRRANGGLAAARNTGLAAVADADFVVFLDADDALTPGAIAAGLRAMAAHPGAGMVYGAFVNTDTALRAEGSVQHTPIDADPLAALLTGNRIGMHATVLFDRGALAACGGYDEALRACEDYDVYLKLAARHPVASHRTLTARYRHHNDNMSRDPVIMLDHALLVLRRHRPDPADKPRSAAFARGVRSWKRLYAPRAWDRARLPGTFGKMARRTPLEMLAAPLLSRLRALRGSKKARSWARRLSGRGSAPPVGRVAMGDLKRITPISDDFGWERGTPIDRHYIEGFLDRNRDAIAGRVLEIGDDSYCRRFGSAVTRQDVLHVDPDALGATVIGDLSQPDVLLAGSFDCLVITQTLQFIYDFRGALNQLARALRPGGVLLLTVPGITPIDRYEWRDSCFWSFTQASLDRLLRETFDEGAQIELATHGNVYAATCQIQGMVREEARGDWLDVVDDAFPVTITARVRKG